MSKEKSSSPESSEPPSAKAVGKRRPAKTRSAKTTKSAKATKPAVEEPVVEKPAPAYPVFDLGEAPPADELSEPATPGGTSTQEAVKRGKRRRKKSKGNGAQATAQPAPSETTPESGEQTAAPASPPRPDRQTRPKLDSESIAKLAWKIYLAEVSEEGVALIGDSDARELARRCFRLAEIFMEEQSRRH